MKKGIFRFPVRSQLKDFLLCPFIYMMIIPTFILDIFLFVFQNIYFRAYNIPFAKRGDYIINDRKDLDYLNIVEKFHCMYCSYVNGIFAYAVEVGGRTEKYWCPIKHARKRQNEHEWEQLFAEYGDEAGFHKCFKKNDYKKD